MDPDEDRRILRPFGRPDVERQAILAHRRQVPAIDARRARFRLHARRAEFARVAHALRSEEHTSELQSLMRISYAVFCLKKKNTKNIHTTTQIEYNNYTTK